MLTTAGIQIVWFLSSNEAIASQHEFIEPEHLFSGILKFSDMEHSLIVLMLKGQGAEQLIEERRQLRDMLESRGIIVPVMSASLRHRLRAALGRGAFSAAARMVIHRSQKTKEIYKRAEMIAREEKAGEAGVIHLLQALCEKPTPVIADIYRDVTGKSLVSSSPDGAAPAAQLSRPHIKDGEAPLQAAALPENPLEQMLDFLDTLRDLRRELRTRVYGQDHAIHAFIEGLYSAEVVASADVDRKRPQAVFVFAGPPGVGKTYTSELAASFLARPFKRFDMTGYTDHQQHSDLIGFAPSFKDAQEGALTGFVRKNPKAVLLFDEIEKAHLNTVQLFYQILDAGRLEDKYTGKDVSFKDTIIIFTTNAGRSLYDNPNKSGIAAAHADYHKRTILSALESEKNPSTGQPAFPPAICSRLGQGFPLMFNHLGINELEQVCNSALTRTGMLLEKHYSKQISHHPLLPIMLVLKEGRGADARQISAEADKFVKIELFKYLSLYQKESLPAMLGEVDSISFGPDEGTMEPEIRKILEPEEPPSVLLIADRFLGTLYSRTIKDVRWLLPSTVDEALDMLATKEVSLVLLDLWLSRTASQEGEKLDAGDGFETVRKGTDFVPLSARALEEGRKYLSAIHGRMPELPIYLLSLIESAVPEGSGGKLPESAINTIRVDESFELDGEIAGDISNRKPIDDELFMACVRTGGARGLLATGFFSVMKDRWQEERLVFCQSLADICRRLYREKQAHERAREHQVLSFETVSSVEKERRQIVVRLRNFKLTRAVEALDAGGMLDEAQRPATRFDDVCGARAAKEAMSFIVEWLRNPHRYRNVGVRPPKGILLTGPPGTGKTMLARALAGESRCAFIEQSAAAFVTMWQGSGPQNIRNLFERAHRYAPAIIFIDEIDAIGRKRMGSQGSGRAEETTLNALLTEMDGFGAKSAPPVIVIAATNLVDELDPALRRRFDREIEVDKPDREARIQYLRKSLSGRRSAEVSETVIDRMAGQSAGMTVADLERIIHEAAVMAAQRESELNDALLEEAFEKVRMGEAKKPPDRESLLRIARHEAGHALVSWEGGHRPVQLTIVGRGHAGGYMERESEEERVIYTKTELEQIIREAMGGRAAEILYYGDESGLSSGVAGDLAEATRIARKMVQEFGMSPEFGNLALESQALRDGPLAIRVKEAAEKIVSTELHYAGVALTRNRALLDTLSERLFEMNRLTGREIEEILGRRTEEHN